MKKTTNINQERSEKYRYLEKLNYVPKLIILASLALIIATISFFRAERAIDAANAATAIATTWQTMYKETERECRLAQMEIDDFKMMLAKAGLNTEHIGEKP